MPLPPFVTAQRPRTGHAAALLLAAAVAGCASARPAAPASTEHDASTAVMATVAAGAAGTSVPAAAPVAPVPAVAVARQADERPVPAAAPARPTVAQAGFAEWRDAFRAEAAAQGIREATLAGALDTARLQPRVLELDRFQPEFTRPVWEYLDQAVSAQRIATGRARLATHRALLRRETARTGVPGAVVVAIWGMESNFGANFGNFPTIDALATLAYDGRRRDWARGELLAALRILDAGDIDRARMVGSWAGAMGHTQFMPSSYLAHAVDADGDGRRDIWGSLPDVFASTAGYLAQAGWRRDEPWGVEVRLPEGFDYAQADLSVRRSAAHWAEAGVRGVGGAPLPPLPGDASVLVPAGARGPAFLVGANFRAILRYNNATSYALAVALLARQIEGGEGVQAAWPRDAALPDRRQILALQQALNARGYEAGAADGLLGSATRAAVRRWQQAAGLAADGFVTRETVEQVLRQQP